jgi:hypothetical protein
MSGSAAEAEHRLGDALRMARIEAAERTGVVVELHDAEVARLELLNEALDPIFAGIPQDVELFDRGISRGETPRLWLDAVAHVVMSRDQRIYRFVVDTRFGRKVLAESMHVREIADAITRYVAQRLIERERSLTNSNIALGDPQREVGLERSRGRRRAIGAFLLGVVAGLAALVIAALISAPR